MNQKLKYITVILIISFSVAVSAQNSQLMYNMRIPQNHLMNPALKPTSLYYIGLPVLTGINMDFNNNFLEMYNLFPKGEIIQEFWIQDLDLDKLEGSLKEKNTISADFNMQLFGLGFMVGPDLNIFIDVIDRVEAKGVFPQNLLSVFINGYEQFLNETISITNLNLKAQYYREFGVGFSKNFTKKLRAGAKAKVLFGMGSLDLNDNVLSLKINSGTSQTVIADASLNVSGQTRMATLQNDLTEGVSIKQILKDYLNTPISNTGIGIDLGAVYDFNKMFSVSVAVSDIGFINWKDDLRSFNASGTFDLHQEFSLMDVVQETISIDSLITSMVEEIQDSIFSENANPSSFRTSLPASLSAGANVNLLKFLSFGVLSTTKFYSGQVKEALTISANTYFGKTFSLSLGYTMANYSYNNFGIGMAFKAGPAQIYLIADKIPVKWSNLSVDRGESVKKIPLPESWNMMNFQLGLNISFGKIVSRKVDKPMVVVE